MNIKNAGVIRSLIIQQVPVNDIKSAILRDDFGYARLLPHILREKLINEAGIA